MTSIATDAAKAHYAKAHYDMQKAFVTVSFSVGSGCFLASQMVRITRKYADYVKTHDYDYEFTRHCNISTAEATGIMYRDFGALKCNIDGMAAHVAGLANPVGGIAAVELVANEIACFEADLEDLAECADYINAFINTNAPCIPPYQVITPTPTETYPITSYRATLKLLVTTRKQVVNFKKRPL